VGVAGPSTESRDLRGAREVMKSFCGGDDPTNLVATLLEA